MKRNIIETVMGGVVLLVAAFFVVFAFSSSGVQHAGGYQVRAVFDDASGLVPGTEVRLAGVKVGTVVTQELDPETYFAVIVMTIDQDIELPKDTSARIVPEGVLGGNLVQLQPGGDEEFIPPDGTITHTQGALNLVDLVGRFVFGSADDSSGL